MICRRLEQMTSFIVMDVLERAQEMERAGESVIHLEVGEPDFNTPEAVKNSAIEALSRGDTHYTHSLGLPDCARLSVIITSRLTEFAKSIRAG